MNVTRKKQIKTPADIQVRILIILKPKSGRVGETVYVPRKILVRLTFYTKAKDIDSHDHIFPISYVAAWSMVKKAGRLVIELRPHDLHGMQPPMLQGLALP